MSVVTMFWMAACGLLFMINLVQLYTIRERSLQLRAISETLQRITEEQTEERVKIITGDHALRRLLVAVNRLLDDKQKSKIHYQQKEMSIRKMLANISHDLKTPLTVVLGYAEMLLLENGQPVSQSGGEPRLQKIRAKTTEILELIQRFFDLARLEAGDQELHIEKVQLNEICKERMLSYYDLIQADNLQVDIDVPDAPLYIMADKKALGRILDNLISNAIRYGSDGRVVGLRLYTEADDVHIDVWDEGAGISEHNQDLVFERSYTLDDSRNRTHPGSGLGLTICKRLTEQMGGQIRLRSKPYISTCFTVSFRLVRDVRIS